MAEEQRYEQSSAPSLCANNCGFFGNPNSMNLCSKCYRDHLLKESRMDALMSSAKTASSSISTANSSSAAAVDPVVVQGSVGSAPETASSGPSRCGACRKRVGLTGFKCRCGTTYCGVHRYPEQHACTFDFQALGKEAIAKANPVIKAAKIDKI